MKKSMKKSNSLRLLFGGIIMIALTLVFSASVSAHGYVKNPNSRAGLCYEGVNYDCGAIQYEPYSVEGHGYYPEEGVPDGQIASGGGAFPELDEQYEGRWAQIGISSGPITFDWYLKANHATSFWRYYITKQDWNPNEPLKRSDFVEFCQVDYHGVTPSHEISNDCVVPERTGYQVIFAYWEIADTANAFYQVIDVNFDGEFHPADTPIGEIIWAPDVVYTAGDQIRYEGNKYEALYWTKGEKPDSSYAWELIGPVDNSGSEDNDNGDHDHGDHDNNGSSNGDNGSDNNTGEDDGDNGSDNNTGEDNGDNGSDNNTGEDNGDNGSDNGDNDSNENDDTSVAAWDADQVYLEGDLVSYDGQTYEAKWWVKGSTPDNSYAWALVESGSDNSDVSTDWNDTEVYTSGDVVTYEGDTYKAKWWTRGNTPSESNAWALQ